MNRRQKTYALELTGLIVSGLGMMLLVIVSAWAVSVAITTTGDVLGSSGELLDREQRTTFSNTIASDAGLVAGVTDESSVEENRLRNSAANWLTEVRDLQGIDAVYRDGVLDRNAQNHARLLAERCQVDIYNEWSTVIGARTSEGHVTGFSEATFSVTSFKKLASELPAGGIDYSRLFTNYEGYGVGVARPTDASGCDIESVLVFHLAEVN